MIEELRVFVIDSEFEKKSGEITSKIAGQVSTKRKERVNDYLTTDLHGS